MKNKHLILLFAAGFFVACDSNIEQEDRTGMVADSLSTVMENHSEEIGDAAVSLEDKLRKLDEKIAQDEN